jgi:hypothetical protein
MARGSEPRRVIGGGKTRVECDLLVQVLWAGPGESASWITTNR